MKSLVRLRQQFGFLVKSDFLLCPCLHAVERFQLLTGMPPPIFTLKGNMNHYCTLTSGQLLSAHKNKTSGMQDKSAIMFVLLSFLSKQLQMWCYTISGLVTNSRMYSPRLYQPRVSKSKRYKSAVLSCMELH